MKWISAEEVDAVLSWPVAVEALRTGHLGERPVLRDILLQHERRSLFNRAAILPAIGAGVKVAAVFPEKPSWSPPQSAEQAVFLLVDPDHWTFKAMIDGAAITRWKTAADSALASRILSREGSRRLLMIGAGSIALSLIEAHLFVRPAIEEVSIWNRTRSRAEALAGSLAREGVRVTVSDDLGSSIASADIITSATGTPEPIIDGHRLRPGAHVDLVGAFSPTMREADDETIRRGSIYVDCYDTALHDIGELAVPLKKGLIHREDVRADLFELVRSDPVEGGLDEITVYKNGGGAHLDLMIAAEVYRRACDSGPPGAEAGR